MKFQTAPRTRGSTLGLRSFPIATLDCPAHAGIDLLGVYEGSSKEGLPRARGDRPQVPSLLYI